ncbi:MAG TPA: DUF3429 family protein [Steroidobacteraceae bacterium]|nr:DUF3429 family protein [Steroidobacteraceae bacterium]
MKPLQHDTAPARLGTAAELLGYLAVAPLLACLAAVMALPGYAAQELAQRAAIAWGAVLLVCGAAVHFGLALAGRFPATAGRMAAATLPALAAAAAVLLGGQRALALLTVAGGLFWLYEHRALGAELPAAYLTLRRNLSLATAALLALVMIASDAAGLL